MSQDIVIAVASVFLLIKALFGFFGWFASEDGDAFVRGRLDGIWDWLDDYSPKDVVLQAINRLNHHFGVLKSRLRYPRLALFCNAAFINYSCGFAYHLVTGNRTVGALLMPLSLAGALFDLMSASITWKLMSKAARSTSAIKIFGHVLLDILLAVCAFCWMTIALTFASYYLAPGATVELAAWISENYSDLVFWQAGLIQFSRSSLLVAMLLLSFTAVVPTTLYLIVILSVLLLRLLPRVSLRFAARLVYLITTDETPVFQRLGNAAAVLAAIAAALAKLL